MKNEKVSEWLDKLFRNAYDNEWADNFELYKNVIIESTSSDLSIPIDDVYKYLGVLPNSILGMVLDILSERFMEVKIKEYNVIDKYLKRFGNKLAKDEKDFLCQLRTKTASIYNVKESIKNEYMILQNLLFDEPTIKIEVEPEEPVFRPGINMFLKIITINNTNRIFGTTVPYLGNLKDLQGSATSKTKEEFIKSKMYRILSEILKPIISDGKKFINMQELNPQTLTFKLKSPKAKVVEILNSLETLNITSSENNEWVYQEKLEILLDTKSMTKAGLLAVMNIEEDKLNCKVLYSKALSELMKILKRELDGHVTFPVIERFS